MSQNSSQQHSQQEEEEDIQIISSALQMPLQIGNNQQFSVNQNSGINEKGATSQKTTQNLSNIPTQKSHLNYLNVPLSAITIQPSYSNVSSSAQSHREINNASATASSARNRSSHGPSLSQGSVGSSSGNDGSTTNSHNMSSTQLPNCGSSTAFNNGQANDMNGGNGSSENIQVFLRMRPLNQREVIDEQVQCAWRIQDNSILLDQNIQNQPYQVSANGVKQLSYAATSYANIMSSGQSKAYTFNKCFDDHTPNQQVYHNSCRDIVRSSLEGINGTIFMYGQTGAGKTFTMLGERYQSDIRDQASGIIRNQQQQQSYNRVNSTRGNKTPLKGSFVGNSNTNNNSHTSSIQTFNANIGNPMYSTVDNSNTAQLEKQTISPISNQKSAGGMMGQNNSTPMRNKNQMPGGVFGGGSANGHRSTLSQIGRMQTTETPRHIKNSASGKNQSGTRIPLPLYKQQSVFNGSTNPLTQSQQQKNSRNNINNNFNKSLSIGGQQLFQTGSSNAQIQDSQQMGNSYGDNCTGQNLADMALLNNPQTPSSSALPNLMLQTSGSLTERATTDYMLQTHCSSTTGCEDFISENQQNSQFFNSKQSMSSARQLNFGVQCASGLNEIGQQRAEGILIQSLKELFAMIKDESYLTSSNTLPPTRSISPIPSKNQLSRVGDSQSQEYLQRDSIDQQINLANLAMPRKVYIIRCSYFEIYNDSVFDLLSDHTEASFHEPLQLQEDIKKKEFIVKGLKEHIVQSLEDCLALLRLGEVNRHYAETKMNHQSSRSHTLFRLHVESVACSGSMMMSSSTNTASDQGNVITESVLNFVDLAGSEKVSNHTQKDSTASSHSQTRKDTSQMRVREGQHINRSLFFLTQVIALKAEGKKNEQHIPYRNSPLTKILRSSLGGNSRTAIILCITPAQNQLEQTLSTLRFGQNAKMIKNQVVANVVKKGAMGEDEAEELKAILVEYERRLGDMQKDSQENHNKLQQVIETLMKEKIELNQRLLKANNKKLLQIIEDKPPKVEENVEVSISEVKPSSHSYHCQIDKKCSDLFQIDYVLALNEKLESQNSKIMISTLKAAKKENRELRSQLAGVEELNEELNKQVENMDRQQEEMLLQMEEIKRQLRSQKEEMKRREQEQQRQREEQQKEREQYHKIVDQMGKQQKNLETEVDRLRETLKLQGLQLDKEVNEKESVIEKYQSLMQNRYAVDPLKIVREKYEKLQEIEMQLFKGIQILNQEKGRRIYQQQQQQNNNNNNMLFENRSSLEVQQFQLDSDMVNFSTQQQDETQFQCNKDERNDFDNSNRQNSNSDQQQQQTQIYVNQEQREKGNNDNQKQVQNKKQLDDSDILDGKPSFVVDDVKTYQKQAQQMRNLNNQEIDVHEDEGNSYGKRLDFDIVDMSKVQRDTSSYLQSNIIPSDQYTIDDQNILNRQSDLQTFQNLEDCSQAKSQNLIIGAHTDNSSIQEYSDAKVINDKGDKKRYREYSPEIPRFTYQNSGNQQVLRDSRQIVKDFIESNDISQISQVQRNRPVDQQLQDEQQQVSQIEYVSQSPINLKQVKIKTSNNDLEKIASVQSLIIEEGDETFDEKTRLREKCSDFQRQINNIKCDKNLKENSSSTNKTPQKYANQSCESKNLSKQKAKQQQQLSCTTPNQLQDSQDQYSRFNFDNEFSDSIRFMINQGGPVTSKAHQNQQPILGDIFNQPTFVNYSNQSQTQSLLLSQTKNTQSSNSKDQSSNQIYNTLNTQCSQLQDEPVNYQVYLSSNPNQGNTSSGLNTLRVSVNTANFPGINQLLAQQQQQQQQYLKHQDNSNTFSQQSSQFENNNNNQNHKQQPQQNQQQKQSQLAQSQINVPNQLYQQLQYQNQGRNQGLRQSSQTDNSSYSKQSSSSQQHSSKKSSQLSSQSTFTVNGNGGSGISTINKSKYLSKDTANNNQISVQQQQQQYQQQNNQQLDDTRRQTQEERSQYSHNFTAMTMMLNQQQQQNTMSQSNNQMFSSQFYAPHNTNSSKLAQQQQQQRML